MWNDIRYALRTMRRTPLFTATVVVTVAIAIAANTSIFSVVNAALLRPLPYRQPDRLVQVAEKNDKLHLPSFGASILNFLDWREQSHAFEGLAAIGFNNYTLSGTGEPEQYSGNLISPALTRVLGVTPLAGRVFTDEEENPSAPPVAMIGEGLWKRRFGSDPSVIGRVVNLNDTPTTIVGIAPASLNLISGGDIYTPLTIDRAKQIRLNHVIIVFGKLRPGVSLQEAQAEMEAISARMGQQYPEIHDWGIRVITLFDTFVSADLKRGLLVLLFAVAFVLLIACANVANLLLARAATRQKEMATRTALGASRGRLVRQLLVESITLSLAGGTAGLMAAFWVVKAINRAVPPNTLPVQTIQIDPAVLWFAFGLTVVTGLIFGIVPAIRTTHVDINEVLKLAGRGASGGIRARLRNGLAAAEIGLATILLIGAGLLIQSLAHLQHVQLGFDAQGLLTFQLSPPGTKYPVTTKAPLLYRSLLDSLRSTPGVKAAAVSSGIPFGAGSFTTHPMLTTGESVLPAGQLVPIDWRIVSPGYFKTMGIPLLRGRDFTDADGPNSQPVMIVSEATAKKFWGDGDPLGRTLTRSADRKTAFTIVGVVADVHNTALNQQSAALYYPMGIRAGYLMDVVVRTNMSPESLLPAVRQKVREIDSELALANVRTMDEWLSNSAAQPRLNTVLLSTFAAMALLIAGLGIYGVLAYSVNQRTREIGVRMALGSTRNAVLRMIVAEGMTVVAAGIAIGVIGGLALGRAVASLVYGVTVHDPATFAAVVTVLSAVSLSACVIPARRAARVDPMVALRSE